MNPGIFYLLVFLSGCVGLIYEILWIKRSSLIFGSSSLALATVLAVFFIGLGLGSYLFGRVGRSLPRPLLWCAGLEWLLALNGFLNPVFFAWTDEFYGLVYRHFELGSTALLSLRGVLMAVLLPPPTLLMGGTLPLFCRQLVRQRSHIATNENKQNPPGSIVSAAFLAGLCGGRMQGNGFEWQLRHVSKRHNDDCDEYPYRALRDFHPEWASHRQLRV